MKALVTSLVALIMCSNLALTSYSARPRSESDATVKVIDDRLRAATSRFAFKLYDQIIKQPAGKLYISEVRHKTWAEVNEEGTEAAAATSVGVFTTSVQQPREKFIMKVDRPFFFAIRDNRTEVVLFMGSVSNPG